MTNANARKFAAVYAKAVAAGMAAGIGTTPRAMIIGTPTTPLGNTIDFTKRVYYETEGACGFAWVTVRPGTCAFARWLAKNKLARAGYHGGMEIWVREFGQTMARKEAYAEAMAKVFTDELGIKAYPGSRMD